MALNVYSYAPELILRTLNSCCFHLVCYSTCFASPLALIHITMKNRFKYWKCIVVVPKGSTLTSTQWRNRYTEPSLYCLTQIHNRAWDTNSPLYFSTPSIEALCCVINNAKTNSQCEICDRAGNCKVGQAATSLSSSKCAPDITNTQAHPHIFLNEASSRTKFAPLV